MDSWLTMIFNLDFDGEKALYLESTGRYKPKPHVLLFPPSINVCIHFPVPTSRCCRSIDQFLILFLSKVVF